ncbi:MAG: ComF family protein [Betaproteobacteria bacterium]|nr:ComF family protein [Betaproteobacteria bacterium]
MSILTRHFLNIRTKLWQALPAQPCFLCGTASRNGVWCAACDADLPYLTAASCPVCALPTHDGATCGHCLQQAPHFDRTVAVFAYAFPLNKLVQALKHNEKLMLANSLADKLTQRIAVRPDYLVAMPLHPARLRARGFNQSFELARHIGRQMDIPVLLNACQRSRDTPPQTALSRKERDKNVRQAFICTQDFSGKHVAIVDDVMTSGASLNEVAQTLRKAGAREISAWVIARTLPHSAS